MRFKLIYFMFLSILLLGSPVTAQDSESPQITEGIGTIFTAVAPDGEITVTSTHTVDAVLHAMPGQVFQLDVMATDGVAATDIVAGGLAPNQVYWIYTVGVVEPTEATTTPEGTLSLSLDLTQPVSLWVQREHSTLILGADGLYDAVTGLPYAGADWDPINRVATLTDDVDELIRILESGTTLDGAGYCVTATTGWYGVTLERSEITVENLNVSAPRFGVGLAMNCTLRNVRGSADPSILGSGGLLLAGHGRIIIIGDPPPPDTFVIDCEFSGWRAFTYFGRAFQFSGLLAYNNNFDDSVVSSLIFGPEDSNIWSDPDLGGNYWGEFYTGVDSDGDGFGDTPYEISLYNVDLLPLMQPITLNLLSCEPTTETAVTVAGTVSSDCDGPLAGVDLTLTLATGETLTATTTATGAYSMEAPAASGPGTIAVSVPSGYETTTASQNLSLDANATVDFALTCIYVDVAGNVSSDCNGPALVTVDLAYADQFLTTATDANGDFFFADIRWTDAPAEIGIVVPLGMTAITPEYGHAAVDLTADAVIPFQLQCLPATGEVRSMGYWKHQARVHLHGKGNAHESYDDMATTFPSLIFSHFYENDLNSIQVPGVSCMVTEAGTSPIDLAQIEQTLTVNRGGTTLERAKQQYLALLLNIASGKLMTWSVVSEDGFTASQALQDVADRINDGDASNDELAKDVAEQMNLGQTVPAGWIRDLWQDIAYKEAPPSGAGTFVLGQNTPNPFNPRTTIRFELPRSMEYVLTVYDTAGRVVQEIRAQGQPGSNAVVWDAQKGSLASGIYRYRLRAGSLEQTRSMVLLK